jgi:hypothetical protein
VSTGRSNVGKSSLINSITASGGVRVSPKPGLTQTINWFEFTMNPKHELVRSRLLVDPAADSRVKRPPLSVALVDLPGYESAPSIAKCMHATDTQPTDTDTHLPAKRRLPHGIKPLSSISKPGRHSRCCGCCWMRDTESRLPTETF